MERIRKLSAPETSGHGEQQQHQQEQQQQGEGEQQDQNVKRTRSKLGFRSRRPSHANGEDASKNTVSTYDAIGYVLAPYSIILSFPSLLIRCLFSDKFKVPQSSFSMSLQ